MNFSSYILFISHQSVIKWYFFTWKQNENISISQKCLRFRFLEKFFSENYFISKRIDHQDAPWWLESFIAMFKVSYGVRECRLAGIGQVIFRMIDETHGFLRPIFFTSHQSTIKWYFFTWKQNENISIWQKCLRFRFLGKFCLEIIIFSFQKESTTKTLHDDTTIRPNAQSLLRGKGV